ncbi:MAG TPA: DUF2231 domain-containing protein [Streptosporangiaceae bacterium]|jgi:uncharacterized membrane protein|nr:DUF2231 domain-containing protein [Streptosporangiaceae bacterium]
MAAGLRHAKRPVSALFAGPYGHPYHPMLVTVPIGAWLISLGFDIASHVAHPPGFLTRGSEWLIAIGVVGAILAGMAGFLDLAIIPTGTRAFRTACIHMFINVTLIMAYAVDFGLRYRTYGNGSPVSDKLILLSAACILALAVSGYLGGKLTFRYGVRVASEASQAEGFLATGRSAAPDAGTRPPARRSHRA